MNRRIVFAVVALCQVGTAVGTALGTAPSWPDRPVWAALAITVAVAALGYAAHSTDYMLRIATSAVVTAATARSAGALLLGTTTASRWSGTAAWALVAILALQVHRLERGTHAPNIRR